MAKAKTLVGYLRSRGLDDGVAVRVQQILEEWRRRGIPLWEQENKRDDQRAALILGQTLSGEELVRFFAPVCPDYPDDSRAAQLGLGLGETIPPVFSLMRSVIPLMEEWKVPYSFTVLLADTEIDLSEVVALLANSVEDFLGRCSKTVTAAQEVASDLFCKSGVQIVPFSKYFSGQWHPMQYFWEGIAREKKEEDSAFNSFLCELAGFRTGKYEKQLGRRCTPEDCFRMAIRHYAQYHALGYWMRQYQGAILVNKDSPNLRAIRRPFVLGEKKHPSLPEILDQQSRIPIIVL